VPGEETTPGKGRAICPECGEDLTGRDIDAHKITHFGLVEPDARLYKEAAKRYQQLTKMAKGSA